MKNHIKIVDWAGNVLFEGHYSDTKVDEVLEANKCPDCKGDGEIQSARIVNGLAGLDALACQECDGTGYNREFSVYWVDENRKDNVYEFINY